MGEIDSPYLNPRDRDVGLEVNEQGRTPYEVKLIETAAPRLVILQEQYEAGGYRDTLSTLTEGKRLDIGFSLSVFRTFHKGHPVIVRVPQVEEQREDVLYRASALALGMGIRRLEQPLAASLDEQVIFSSPLNGKESDHLQKEEVIAIPEQHITEVISTFEEACGNGLKFDFGASNIFYDPRQGFSFTDYSLQNHPRVTSPQESFATFLFSLGCDPHTPFFTDSQQRAWKSVIPDVRHTFAAVYPEAGDVLEQIIHKYEE